MAKLVITEPDGSQSEHLIVGDTVTVGRSKECDVRPKSAHLSRLHALIKVKDGRLVVQDQASSTGTWVNGEAKETAELSNGDEIKLGDVVIRVDMEGGPRRSTVRTRAESRRREAGQANDGDEAARPAERRISRARRQILGGAKLTTRQQTVIKVICALVMFASILGVLWIISSSRKRPAVIRIENVTTVDPLADAQAACSSARSLFQQAMAQEEQGRAGEALGLMKQAESKMAAGVDGYVRTLEDPKYRGPGGGVRPEYRRHESRIAEWNTQLRGIREQLFRLDNLVNGLR